MPEDSELQSSAAEPGADFEYDEAHDAATAPGSDEPGPKPEHPIYVATQTGDYDGGDYEYDLAHDIPGR